MRTILGTAALAILATGCGGTANLFNQHAKIFEFFAALNESGQLNFGEIRLFPLGQGETASVSIQPERSFDCGAGAGKDIEREVGGGTVGLILDARGRPLVIPDHPEEGRELLEKWVSALELYPEIHRAPLQKE